MTAEHDSRAVFGRPDPSGVAILAAFEDSADLLSALLAASDGEEILRLQARARASRKRGIVLPLATAFDAWSLTTDDWLVAAAWLREQLAPSSNEAPTVGRLAERAGNRVVADRLMSGQPLQRYGLLTVAGSDGAPWAQRPVIGAPRLLPLAHGAVDLDGSLDAVFAEPTSSTLTMDHDGELVVGAILRNAQPGDLAVIAGAADSNAICRHVASLASRAKRRVLVARASRVRDDAAALAREALLFGAVVLLVEDEPCVALVNRLISLVPLLVVGLPIARAATVRCWPPAAHERLGMWRDALGADVAKSIDLHSLAAMQNVDDVGIARIAERARMFADARPIDAAVLRAAVRAELPPIPEQVAVRSDVESDALVAPDAIREKLSEIVEFVRQRHQIAVDASSTAADGVVALLVGLPGTGKSLVALTVARELLADCYELNLHRLIATWSLQTEHDLTMLLAAVDAGHIVLHVEAAELLTAQTGPALAMVASWLERATGVVLLSTTTAFVRLDPALLRRIKIEIAMPFPDEGTRAEIWRRHLPSNCDVDVEALAKHALTGRAIVQTIERGQIIARVHGRSLTTDVMSAAILERIDEPIRR